MTILLLLASIAWGQASTDTLSIPLEDELKLQNVRKDVREILVGRPTVTGLPTFKNGVKFGDGTTQTTAATASVWVGTYTVINSGSASFTNTTFVACSALFSTVTFTSSAVPLRLTLHLPMRDNTDTGTSLATVLMDGAHITSLGLSNAIGFCGHQVGATSRTLDCHADILIPASAVSAASHSFCVAFSEPTAATGSVLCASGRPCYLKIEEAH